MRRMHEMRGDMSEWMFQEARMNVFYVVKWLNCPAGTSLLDNSVIFLAEFVGRNWGKPSFFEKIHECGKRQYSLKMPEISLINTLLSRIFKN